MDRSGYKLLIIMNKTALRPKINTITSNNKQTLEESFQNTVLRPVLKLQNDLIFAFFNSYLKENKILLVNKNLNEIIKIIDTIFKNQSFRLELRGLIIGLLTVEEYNIFVAHKKELSKRIFSMCKERISSKF